MKIWVEMDNGAKIEAREITSLDTDSEILFFFCRCVLRPETAKEIEDELTEKSGKKCVVIDDRFCDKILCI